jgi:hypothetical protein
MNRSTRSGPIAALLLIGGAAAIGPVIGPMAFAPEPEAQVDVAAPGPGKVWCPEHQTWHEDRNTRFDPMRPGPITPPGKVWVPEHWHFHDLPK